MEGLSLVAGTGRLVKGGRHENATTQLYGAQSCPRKCGKAAPKSGFCSSIPEPLRTAAPVPRCRLRRTGTARPRQRSASYQAAALKTDVLLGGEVPFHRADQTHSQEDRADDDVEAVEASCHEEVRVELVTAELPVLMGQQFISIHTPEVQ